MTTMAKVHARRSSNFDCLMKHLDNIGIADVMTALRSHGDNDKKEEWHPLNSKFISVCAHASGLTSPSLTTNSMVLWIPKEGPYSAFSTASSTVCTSVYKLLLATGLTLPKEYNSGVKQAHLDAHWWKAEQFNRVAMNHYSQLPNAYFPERTKFEKELIRKVLSQKLTQTDLEESFTEANRLMDKYYVQLKALPIDKNAKKRQKYWKKHDTASGLLHLDK